MASDSGDSPWVTRACDLLELSHRFNPTDIPSDRPNRLARRQSLHEAPNARLSLLLGGESQLRSALGNQTEGSLVEHRLVTIRGRDRIPSADLWEHLEGEHPGLECLRKSQTDRQGDPLADILAFGFLVSPEDDIRPVLMGHRDPLL